MSRTQTERLHVRARERVVGEQLDHRPARQLAQRRTREQHRVRAREAGGVDAGGDVGHAPTMLIE